MSAVGFSYYFSLFAKGNLNYVFGGSVAGVSNYKATLTIELRTNNKLLSEEVSSDLSNIKDVNVSKLSYTSKFYPEALLIDLSDGSKVAEISALENEIMVGSTKELPQGEASSEADLLLIVTTK